LAGYGNLKLSSISVGSWHMVLPYLDNLERRNEPQTISKEPETPITYHSFDSGSDAVVGRLEVAYFSPFKVVPCLLVSRKRWQITLKHASSFEGLKKSVRSNDHDNPCVSGLRSVCWKVGITVAITVMWLTPIVSELSTLSKHRYHEMASSHCRLAQCLLLIEGAFFEIYRKSR